MGIFTAGNRDVPCMQVDLSKAWLTFSSIVLAFAFVFGNSIRNMYEAVIFLFVVHPFDVGDVLLMGADQTWCKVSVLATAWPLLSICCKRFCSAKPSRLYPLILQTALSLQVAESMLAAPGAQ